MPPLPQHTGLSRVSNLTASNGPSQLPEILVIALVFATCTRLVILRFTQKRRISSTVNRFTQEKEPLPRQEPVEKIIPDLLLDSRDTIPSPTFIPIYPWIGPPLPLPGPYDPRVYPLPTLRRHSSVEPSQEATENETISYTRRVSTNSIPVRQITLHGTITTSQKGWRRNQWVVSGG